MAIETTSVSPLFLLDGVLCLFCALCSVGETDWSLADGSSIQGVGTLLKGISLKGLGPVT